MASALAIARWTAAGTLACAGSGTTAAPPVGRPPKPLVVCGCAPPVAATLCAGTASASSSVPKHTARAPPRTSIHLFRRPTGLADGLAQKEPAPPAEYRAELAPTDWVPRSLAHAKDSALPLVSARKGASFSPI